MEDRDVTWTQDVEWPASEPLPIDGKPVENLERFGIKTDAVAYAETIVSAWTRDKWPEKVTVTLRFYLPIL